MRFVWLFCAIIYLALAFGAVVSDPPASRDYLALCLLAAVLAKMDDKDPREPGRKE